MMVKKKGVHFTEDFKCVNGLPGIRSTIQNYTLECKVTKKMYTCLTIPTDKRAKGGPEVENFRALLRKLDHYALPRLVQENESDNRLYLIMAQDPSN